MNYWMAVGSVCFMGAAFQAAFWDHKYLFAGAYLCWGIANSIITYLDFLASKG